MLNTIFFGAKTNNKLRDLLYFSWNVYGIRNSCLTIPLDTNYNKDSQKLFVNSCIIYSANISLLTIAYGYKMYILLFQKHHNTKEAFKKIMLEAIRKNVEKQTKQHRN